MSTWSLLGGPSSEWLTASASERGWRYKIIMPVSAPIKFSVTVISLLAVFSPPTCNMSAPRLPHNMEKQTSTVLLSTV